MACADINLFLWWRYSTDGNVANGAFFFNRTLEETIGNVTYGYLIHQQYQF